ncbi:MAG: hypothetical protein NUW01_20200 [Gemmatimonadaceae bacterium]|nr:hypothetical protein [Gemmatimonadaceae bacterium]
MNVNISHNRTEVRDGEQGETVVIECNLNPREIEKFVQLRDGEDVRNFVAAQFGLDDASVVTFKEGMSDNPEDQSMACARITLTLKPEHVRVVNELRGGDALAEYARRCLPVQRGSEYQEQAEEDQTRPWAGMPEGEKVG